MKATKTAIHINGKRKKRASTSRISYRKSNLGMRELGKELLAVFSPAGRREVLKLDTNTSDLDYYGATQH